MERRLDFASKVFLAGRLLSNVAEQLALYALPLLVFEATRSVAKSGQAFFTEWLPGVLLLPFLGSLTDRFSERRVYLGSELSRAAIAVGGLCALRLHLMAPFIVLTAAAAGLAILHSQNYVALETTIVRRFAARDLAHVQSLVEGIESVAEIVGPALAGALVAVCTKPSLLALAAGAFVASGLSVLALRRDHAAPIPRRCAQPLADVKRGFEIVVGLPRILALAVISFILNVLVGVVLATNPAVAKTVLDIGDGEFAWIGIVGGSAGAALMFGLPGLLRRIELPALRRISLCLLAAAGALLGWSRNLAPFVLGYACLSCAVAMFNVYVRVERARAISSQEFGRAISVVILIARMGMPVAGILVTLAGTAVQPQSLVLALSGASILAIFTILRFLNHAAQNAAVPESSHDVN